MFVKIKVTFFVFILSCWTVATKKTGFIDSKTKPILFLHIGKAGGGTINNIIERNGLGQYIEVWHPQGVLEKTTKFRHIIINARDPVSRAISAINFDCLPRLAKTGSSMKCCERVRMNEQCKARSRASDFFKGSSNSIGEALIGKSLQRKEKAAMLMNSFVHTKMSFVEHVGGVDVLKSLVSQNTTFYFIVLDNKNFIEQVTYQFRRVFNDVSMTKEERIKARHITLPKSYNTHASFSNYSQTAGAAQRGFATWYQDDYEPIKYLGEVGCGDNEDCLIGVNKILQGQKYVLANTTALPTIKSMPKTLNKSTTPSAVAERAKGIKGVVRNLNFTRNHNQSPNPIPLRQNQNQNQNQLNPNHARHHHPHPQGQPLVHE